MTKDGNRETQLTAGQARQGRNTGLFRVLIGGLVLAAIAGAIIAFVF